MKDYDAAIMGGGPVGGYVAKKIAQNGFKVAVLEEHKKIGEPLKCAGLVTPRVFDFLDFSEDLVVQNRIKGAHIHSPSDHILTIGGDKVHALAIDRSEFDREMINYSVEEGADIFLENKVTSAEKNENHIELKTSQNNDIKCKLLIGADGAYSKTREWFNLPKPTEILNGIGAELTNTNLDPDFVELFVGKNIAPGFFAWVIPTNENGTSARIGLCTIQNSIHPPKYYLSNLFKNKILSSYLKDAKITQNIGGSISLGALKKTYSSNVLLVGDSAAQVKPTSGGGIYTGLLCATHCSSVAIESLNENDFSSNFLKKYHKLWTADIGRELSLGMKFRNISKNLTDSQMDKYIEKFQNSEIAEIITKYGDIDHPSKLVKPLLKKAPSLLKFLPNIIKD
jgi:digeranylgeranylglycerophospholipid reductase